MSLQLCALLSLVEKKVWTRPAGKSGAHKEDNPTGMTLINALSTALQWQVKYLIYAM